MSDKNSFYENPENRYDIEMRSKALNKGEASHKDKMEDEQRLGVPGFDESLASDYIRNRIEPSADMIGGRTIFKVEAVEQPEEEYEIDLKKLQSLTENQLDDLLTEVENKSKEGQGLFSKGALLNGYAIDSVTLESLQSVHHDSIAFELAADIVAKLKNKGDMDADIDKIKRKVVSGLVYLEVPGFKTPIVRLWLGMKEMGNAVPEQDIEKISRRIKQDRKLLPISADLKSL